MLMAGITLLTLLSWLLRQWRLGTLGNDFIPMAPSTGLLFLVLAGATGLEHRQPAFAAMNQFGFAAGFGVLVMSLLIEIQILFDIQLLGERWLTNTTETVGQIPVDQMSPLTAAVFILSSLAFLLKLAPESRRRSRQQTVMMNSSGHAQKLKRQGDALFDRYDIIANRLVLLCEFDLSYHNRYGVRITGTVWGDTAYGDREKSNPREKWWQK